MPHEDGNRAYLYDMLEASERIARFISGKSGDDFEKDDLLRSAVERQIEIIGEAARRISPEFRELHSEIPWRPVIAQRHILAHEYGEVQHDLIWRVATIHVPALRIQLITLQNEP